MLAARGLLACQNSAQYSSSSEESETEEYLRVRDDINPITGVFEPPKPDPLERKLTNINMGELPFSNLELSLLQKYPSI